MTLDLEAKKDQGSFLVRRVAADKSLPAWVIVNTPLGVTRFLTACFTDHITSRKGRFFIAHADKTC